MTTTIQPAYSIILPDNQTTFSSPSESISSSWSSMLYNILKLPSSPPASNHTKLRHCSGNIWRNSISVSIYHDLASISTTDCPTTTRTTRRRRFVRLEHIGISGVILYEIRMCSPRHLSQGGGDIDMEECLTMQGVFGDPDFSEHGMDLDDLLDAVDAKVVHFPAYACTSFIVGQVMNAHLTNRPEWIPIPASSGFSILGSETPSVICTSLTPEMDPCSDDALSCGFHLGDLQQAFSLTEDDPYLALCVRTSSSDSCGVRLYSGASSSSSDSDQEVGDGSADSSIDSLGPCNLAYGPFPPIEWDAVSKDLPGFVSPGLLQSTEENDLVSFIDFTRSWS